MSVEPATRKLYESTARRFERWLKEAGRDPRDPDEWVAALQALTDGRSRASWRLYRHAITWHLRETQGAIASGNFSLASGAQERPPTKKRPVLRHIEPDVLEAIVRALLARKTTRAARLADIMIAMVVTGLRPSEFASAKMDNGPVRMLVVANAKFRVETPDKPGRGNGPTRELIIDECASPQLVGAIVRALDWCQGREWTSLAPNANRLLRSTINGLVRRRVIGTRWLKLRLYDCRHQFSANAKEHLDLLAGEVAAAMGHRSVVTAVSHYGRRKFARSAATMVRPSARSVAYVSEASKVRVLQMIQKAELRRDGGALKRDAARPEPETPQARDQKPRNDLGLSRGV